MSCVSRDNLCPSSGDTENVLLQKILQSLNEGGGVTGLSVNGGPFQTGDVSIVTGGGGGGGVASVNGDPGPAVLLDSGEIPESGNLYFTTARVRATDLTGFSAAVGGTVTAADTILDALGKFEFRVALNDAKATGSDRVLRAGDTMTGALLLPAGTAAAPALSFSGDPNTGLFSVVDDSLGFSTGGVLRLTLSTTDLTSTVPFLGPAGTVAAPTFSFATDSDTGIYRSGTNQIGFVTQGTERMRLTTTQVLVGPQRLVFGSTLGLVGLTLQREADNVWSQHNGTTAAQTARWYETTDADLSFANYSRTTVVTQAGNHLIRTEAAGTGTLRILQVGSGPENGTDQPGVDSIFHAGQSTGNAVPGSILFQTATVGASGTTVATLATRLTLSTTALTSTVPLLGPTGLVTAPTYSFSGDSNTGIYSAQIDTIGFATGGTIHFYVNQEAAHANQYRTVGTALTYAATTDIDFSLAGYRMLNLTGNITFTTSNKTADWETVIRITADGSTRTFTFPAWTWVTAIPASILAGTSGMLSLRCEGGTEASVFAAWTTP